MLGAVEYLHITYSQHSTCRSNSSHPRIQQSGCVVLQYLLWKKSPWAWLCTAQPCVVQGSTVVTFLEKKCLSIQQWSGISTVAQQVKNPTSIHEDVGPIPGLPQWVKDLVLPGTVWYRSQVWLGSYVAMAVAMASSCSSNSTPNPELPAAVGTALKKKKKKKRAKNKTPAVIWGHNCQ